MRCRSPAAAPRGASLDDDGGNASGSVCVFERAGAGWAQTAQLVAADAEVGALFGNSVALDGETLAVGRTPTTRARPMLGRCTCSPWPARPGTQRQALGA
jgi:hypothetical protein